MMKRDIKTIIKESGVLEGLKTQEDVSNLLKELHSDLLEAMLHDLIVLVYFASLGDVCIRVVLVHLNTVGRK
ncbi:MAG: hypothetical protein PHI70_04555 [Proteiniphilum sp.]|nr:hypothetical protein [Proteiniphilum sp.]MDD3908738.1 hypothetical protein [Proteiniphilum sp.]MDD4416038.1 hypothetical protein [Proteiniphilum sp.]